MEYLKLDYWGLNFVIAFKVTIGYVITCIFWNIGWDDLLIVDLHPENKCYAVFGKGNIESIGLDIINPGLYL